MMHHGSRRIEARAAMFARRNDSEPRLQAAEALTAGATKVDVFMCLPSDTVQRAALASDVAFVLPITTTVGAPRQPKTITVSRPSATPMAEAVAGMAPGGSNPGIAAGLMPGGEAGVAAAMGTMMIDPANGPFLGGAPTGTGDVLLTVIFLILFALGAFTHISIYRANSKRGHKFLISDLIFDFCMVRIVTCVFRIIWAFFSPRGIVLAAQIFQNAGAVVIFAANLFFTQRIVRAMHPRFGWHPAFQYFSLFLIFSIPAVIVMNVATISVSFYSVGNEDRLEAAEEVLKFGSSWNLMLSLMPLVMIFLACAFPGPPPEPFGEGALQSKGAILVFSATTLAVGGAIRLAAIVNPMAGLLRSPLFDKSVFYVTGFMLEILTVIAYAYFRVDLLFHIPNGSSKPGDYSAGAKGKARGGRAWTAREIEKEFIRLGIRYERLQSSGVADNNEFIAMFYPTFNRASMSDGLPVSRGTIFSTSEGELAPRGERVSRRQTVVDAFKPSRPQRASRTTLFETEKLPPSRFDHDSI